MKQEEYLRWLAANKMANASFPKTSIEHADSLEKALQYEKDSPNLGYKDDIRAIQREKDFHEPHTINHTFHPILSHWTYKDNINDKYHKNDDTQGIFPQGDPSKATNAWETYGQPSEEREATMVLGTKDGWGNYTEENPSDSALREQTRQKFRDEARFIRLQKYLKDNQFEK